MRKQIIPLVVGVAAGLVALGVGYHYLNQLKNMSAGKPASRSVLVAVRPVAVAARITEDDVKAVSMPQALIPPGSISDLKQVVGKSLKIPLVERQPVLESMMSTGKGFGGVIPPGYLAVSVKVDEYTGVAGFLQPGDHVAVMGTFRVQQQGKDETVSKIILNNVEVRAVGQQFREDAGKNGEANLVRSVTVLVTPENAERLQLAAASGRIYLAMNAPWDTDTNRAAGTGGVTLSKLLGVQNPAQVPVNYGDLIKQFFAALPKVPPQAPPAAPPAPALAKAPSPPAKQPYMVELIHADQVDRIYFESSSSDRPLERKSLTQAGAAPKVGNSGL